MKSSYTRLLECQRQLGQSFPSMVPKGIGCLGEDMTADHVLGYRHVGR